MNLPDNDISLALKAKSTGLEYYRNNNFSKAFANYLLALTIQKDWLEELKDGFVHSLCEWGSSLEKEKRFNDLFTCYEEALKVYPKSQVILNNLGAHLLRLNHIKEASHYFRHCLNIDPLYLPAYRNIENVSNLLVERWHFRMLNDQNRNESYRRAIHSVIKHGDTVLDIGTGTGILSLFAAEKEPKNVVACDCSEVMTSIAKDIIDKNGFSQTVKVVNELSTNLNVDTHIPNGVSHVITEIVDAGLLGEGLLQSLKDAWNRLLHVDPTNCSRYKVIPQRAALFVAPIESLNLARNFKYISEDRQKNVLDFILNLKVKLDEPYDSEHLKSFGFKFLSEPTELFNFDFNDCDSIEEYLQGRNNRIVKLVVKQEGYLDAFAVWFELHLSESERISTRPTSHIDSCWEQAVFPTGENIKTDRGAELHIAASTTGGKLLLQHYNLNGTDLNENNSFKVSKDMVRFLNSPSTLNMLDEFLKKLMEKQCLVSNKKLEILDLFVYPFVGFKLLESRKGHVMSFHCNNCDVVFLKWYAAKKKIDETCYTTYLHDMIGKLDRRSKLDLAILDLFNADGELNEMLMTLYPVIKRNLKEDAVIFPEEITIQGQLIYSSWLKNNSELDNSWLLGKYKGFSALNDFKVNQFIDLDINKLDHVKMSPVLNLAKMGIDEIFTDALKQFNIDTEIVCEGPINSILYWFVFGSKSVMLASNSKDFYRNQAAQMFKTLTVNKGHLISVSLNYMSCILKFSINMKT